MMPTTLQGLWVLCVFLCVCVCVSVSVCPHISALKDIEVGMRKDVELAFIF